MMDVPSAYNPVIRFLILCINFKPLIKVLLLHGLTTFKQDLSFYYYEDIYRGQAMG